MAKMTKQEKEWRAQSDAHTLARAEEIRQEPQRLKAAQVEAAKTAQEYKKAAANAAKVAKDKGSARPAKKASVKRAPAKRSGGGSKRRSK